MKFHTEEEILTKYIGKEGTPKRDAFDKEIEDFLIGEAIKKTRLQQNLTQKQLGELVGVKEAQISKIESGKSITWNTIVKVFKAMGANSGVLDLGDMGRVALW